MLILNWMAIYLYYNLLLLFRHEKRDFGKYGANESFEKLTSFMGSPTVLAKRNVTSTVL